MKNGEFCLHTINNPPIGIARVGHDLVPDKLIPFWTTRLETDELKELRDAIDEALLTATK